MKPCPILALLLNLLVLSSPLHAEKRINYALDGSITGAAIAGSFLLGLIPVDTTKKLKSEWLAFDESVKKNFSSSAAALSDGLLTGAALLPFASYLIGGMNEDFGRSALIYTEAIGITMLLNTAVKYMVQRPRPYTYNPDPRVQAYVKQEGKDSRLSFYSGHSALSFTSAVAGASLFAQSSADTWARAVIWGVEMFLAAATANLRVRAGKHFYSDVIVGSLLGAAVGFLVPYLHRDRQRSYLPAAGEWVAMAGGFGVGLLLSQLLPFKQDIKVPLEKRSKQTIRYMLMPMTLEKGGGFMVAGVF